MSRRVPFALLAITLLLAPACDDGGGGEEPLDAASDAAPDVAVDDADATPDAGPELPEPILWEAGPTFEPGGSFVEAHPEAFARMNRWVTHVEGPVSERPEVGARGGYGTGNGHTFALFGMTDPLNTLHGLAGPTYERRPYFFGDYAIRLAPDGVTPPPEFEEEWAASSLSAPVVLTRGVLGDLRLDTVDFAPRTDDATLRACLVRVLTVTNTGTGVSAPHSLVVRAANPVDALEEGALLETMDERVLTTLFVGEQATAEGRELRLEVGALDPGAERLVTLVHCSAAGDQPVDVPAVDAGALLDETGAQYRAWEEGLVQVEVPDPRVADFIDGMKMTLEVQTASTGASCPMSMYSRTWARDNIGPALGWLALGAFDEVEAMMDYVHGAVLLGGDLSNSYDADLDVSDPPAAPDWDAMGPLSARVAAETPSYMVWIYGAWWRHTGRLEEAEARWGFLRRCMMAQGFGPDGMLPFTGDETFRAAMNATFGLKLETPHHEEGWSANSSLLWMGAHGHYEALASRLGHTADVTAAAERYEELEAGFLEHFLLDDGCVSPLRDRETGETWPAPFEDVALKVTWAGWKDGDASFARDSLGCLMDRLRWEPGRVQSPIHEEHLDNPLLPEVEGVYTGMLPGYTLSALTEAGHPEAEDAFNVMGEALGTSGNLQEYQIADDHRGLTFLYDASGKATDYTAKFRPWEGGIVLAAAIEYLLGWAPDSPERTLALRPHLPNDWPSMAFRGLRAGDHRFDVEVERAADGAVVVRVVSHATEAYDLRLRWDAAEGTTPSFTVDGEAVPEADVERVQAFGRESVRLPTRSVEGGGTIEVQVR